MYTCVVHLFVCPFNLEGQGHILLLMVNYRPTGANAKFLVPKVSCLKCICITTLKFDLQGQGYIFSMDDGAGLYVKIYFLRTKSVL